MVGSINSGGMNAALMKQMQEEMFNKADVNGDGKITKDELEQVSQGKEQQKGPTADEVLTSFDTDKDGSISRLESDAGLAKIAQQMQGQEAPQGKSAPPSGGPPPGGGGGKPSGSTGTAASSTSSNSDITYDKKDANKDGVVTALEELEYALKHPDAVEKEDAATSSSADTAATKSYAKLSSSNVAMTTVQNQINISL